MIRPQSLPYFNFFFAKLAIDHTTPNDVNPCYQTPHKPDDLQAGRGRYWV